MDQVWKFVLEPEIEIEIPEGAELLSVATQGDQIFLWAKVSPSAEKVKRTFVGFGTGHDIPTNFNLDFVGTALFSNGALVYHIFEKVGEK